MVLDGNFLLGLTPGTNLVLDLLDFLCMLINGKLNPTKPHAIVIYNYILLDLMVSVHSAI